MKNILCYLVFCLLCCQVSVSQITVQPNLPSNGVLQKNQLWNLLLINGSNSNQACRLELIIRDRSTGQEILTATTNQFDVPKGSKQLNENTLSPIMYNYIIPGINNSIQGYLPPGVYSICYLLSTPLKEMVLAEECISVDSEPLSPPSLIFPSDSTTIEKQPSQFSWIPPVPAGMFDQLKYEVVVKEIDENQKAEDAILNNPVFFSEMIIHNTTLNYPTSSRMFKKDKWYAWQVIAKDNGAYEGKSQIWVFQISEKMETKNFLIIQNDLRDTYIVKDRVVRIKYSSSEKKRLSKIVVENARGKEVQVKEVTVNSGDNYFELELSNKFQKNNIYRLKLSTNNNISHTLNFQIK